MNIQDIISKCFDLHNEKYESKDFKNVSHSDNSVFDLILNSIEEYNNRKVSSISELKKREAKKYRGDIWEEFCYHYLVALGKYNNVWFIKDLPSKYKTKLGLPKADNGIDIICEDDGVFTAIQCKYRAKKNAYITWKGLSTFVALTSLYNGWEDKIVMTNCKGISIKVKGHGLSKMSYKFFSETDRHIWERMIKSNVKRADDKKEKIIDSKRVNLDDMRAKRISYYENMLKG